MQISVSDEVSLGALQLKPISTEAVHPDLEMGRIEAVASDLPKQSAIYKTLCNMPERTRQISEKRFLEITNLEYQGDELDDSILDGLPEPGVGFIGGRIVVQRTPAKFLFINYTRENRQVYCAYDVQQYDMTMPPDILKAYKDAENSQLFDRYEIWEVADDPYLIGVIDNLRNRNDIDRFFLIGSWDEQSLLP